MLRFNLLILLGGYHNICLWSTEFATNCLAICHHSLALGSSHIQILKKSDKCKTVAFSSFETSMENSCSDKQPRSHLQPLATTCNHLQPLATTCNHLQPLATTCNHLQPLAATCSHLQPLAATCSHLQPLAATCSHLQPLAPQPQAATSSRKQPQAATSSHKQPQAAASSRKQPQAAAKSSHKKQPQAATCRHLQPPAQAATWSYLQLLAATCSYLQPLAATCPSSHLPKQPLAQVATCSQPQAAASSHLPPLAATCPSSHLPKQPLAATCSHLQPLAATCSHLQPPAASCSHLQPLAAIGKWLQVAALKIKLRTPCAHNVLKSIQNHIFFGFGVGIRFWSRFWRGEASVLPTWFYWLLQAGACKLHWGGCVKVAIAHVDPWCSMVYCSSLLANPIEVAASILLWVAAANVILFPAACKSHWGGCVTAALCCYCVQ